MNLKRLLLEIQEENKRNLDNSGDYTTLAESKSQQIVSKDDSNTVHYRRDLDSLG